jgi:hypothetical protein
MSVLDVYRVVNGVPIYMRPLNLYDRIKHVPGDILRKKNRCFLSENSRWKSRVKSIIHTERSPVDFDLKLVKIIVMGRAKSPRDKEECEKTITNMGLRLNPYGMGSEVCFGFYAVSFDDIEKVVRALSNRIDGVAIVNTVWYIKYPAMINLKKLIEVGFTPREEKAFKAVTGVLNYSTVRIFYTGTVGVYAPHTEESVKVLGEQLYDLLRRVGALL